MLEQAIPVYERHWARTVPEPAWPGALSACRRDAKGRLHVSRGDVFNVAAVAAADPTPENCERTMVAVAAWGAGTRWYSVVRSSAPWKNDRDRFPSTIGEKLQDAVHVLFDGGPSRAYERLLKGAGHVTGLGPAFFTKFLYFVGYDLLGSTLRPLILDRYVARGMNKLRGTEWPDSSWSLRVYLEYLEWARAEAHGTSPVATEDEAEYRIWLHGRP